MPEKLKVELAADAPMLRTSRTNTLNVQADFLYGAPASGLTVEGDSARRYRPCLPAFNKYSFGLEAEREKFEPPLITLSPRPDTDGRASRARMGGRQGEGDGAAAARPGPVRVFEPGNGRATKTDKTLPAARARSISAFVRPSGATMRAGAETGSTWSRSTPRASRAAPSVDYKIERITYSYQWYQSDGSGAGSRSRPSGWSPPTRLPFKADAPAHLASSSGGRTGSPSTIARPTPRPASPSTVGWWGGSGTEDAPDAARGERQEELRAGRHRQAAARGAVRRQA